LLAFTCGILAPDRPPLPTKFPFPTRLPFPSKLPVPILGTDFELSTVWPIPLIPVPLILTIGDEGIYGDEDEADENKDKDDDEDAAEDVNEEKKRAEGEGEGEADVAGMLLWVEFGCVDWNEDERVERGVDGRVAGDW